MDITGHPDAESLRCVKRTGGDQHGGKADQRMEEGHKLRHFRHDDAPRQHCAERAADRHADDDQNPG
jgi:hypothetical protein